MEIPLRFNRWTAAAGVACWLAAGSAQAQAILAEGFNDVAALPAAGWTFLNDSTAPGTSWFQGNPGIFVAESGLADSYAAANFLGTTGLTGTVSNWMITPQLSLDQFSVINFVARVAGDGFEDTLQVLVSTTGTAPGDFSLVGTYSSAVDSGWVPLSFSAGLAGATQGYIALRYFIADVATQGNYIGVDNVAIIAVPEPASLLLMALGVAGVAGLHARRRRQ